MEINIKNQWGVQQWVSIYVYMSQGYHESRISAVDATATDQSTWFSTHNRRNPCLRLRNVRETLRLTLSWRTAQGWSRHYAPNISITRQKNKKRSTYPSFICFAIAMKASSTPAEVLADVSSIGMDNWSANSCAGDYVSTELGRH